MQPSQRFLRRKRAEIEEGPDANCLLLDQRWHAAAGRCFVQTHAMPLASPNLRHLFILTEQVKLCKPLILDGNMKINLKHILQSLKNLKFSTFVIVHTNMSHAKIKMQTHLWNENSKFHMHAKPKTRTQNPKPSQTSFWVIIQTWNQTRWIPKTLGCSKTETNYYMAIQENNKEFQQNIHDIYYIFTYTNKRW